MIPSIRRPKLHTVVAAAIATITLGLLAFTYGALVVVPWPHSPDAPTFEFDSIFGALELTFGLVGAVLAWRVPRNALGWLMAGIALLASTSMAGGTYGAYNVTVAHGAAPAGVFFSWLANWAFQPAIILAVFFIPLLYPSGRLPSRRWVAFAWLGVFAIVTTTLESAFGPWPPGQYPGTPNPYELHGSIAVLLQVCATFSNITAIPALVIVFGSLVARVRRSHGVERQQFKLFAFAGSLPMAATFASNLTSGPLSDSLFLAAMAFVDLVPIAIAVAILRYRLFEIDVVINRTLVYGALTVVLACVYAASVLALETVLSPLTRSGSLAVAASTLLVAALFTPVRRRVQNVVDRRFYRRRYDTAREVAGFGTRLRDELEPEHVSSMIAATLDRTVQPAFASIWLRESGR